MIEFFVFKSFMMQKSQEDKYSDDSKESVCESPNSPVRHRVEGEGIFLSFMK